MAGSAAVSDAQRDPHVLISARIGASSKLLGLPSHRARWGWIVILGQAKLQHPPGVFDSLKQLRFLAGEFRDCVTDYLDAKLLHALPAARACPRCAEAFPGLEGDVIVVHDWREHQERVSRTTQWRRDKASDDVSLKQPGNNDERFTPRTGAHTDGAVPVLGSRSLVGGSPEGGLEEGEVAVFALLAQNGAAMRPEGGLGRRLLALMERRTPELVLSKASEMAATARFSDRQWVFGLEAAMEQIPDAADLPQARRSKGPRSDPEAAYVARSRAVQQLMDESA